jgi:hypothetical protein
METKPMPKIKTQVDATYDFDCPAGLNDDANFPPTMIIIASGSTQAAVDLMKKFNQMFGDEARYSIATDGTNAGGWPLTLAFGEIGCHFQAEFVEPILGSIADKMGNVHAANCCYGDGDPAYKVQPPSWQEVDGTYF